VAGEAHQGESLGPKSIQNFARLVMLSILIGLVETAFTWDQSVAQLGAANVSSGLLIGAQLLTLALLLLLVWWIVKKGSNVARWIYVALGVIGLLLTIPALGEVSAQSPLQLIMLIVQAAITILTIWLLFRPDSAAWFSDGRGETDPEIFS
jgi:hypothetical protein